jgi:hypothetical protein
VSAESESSSELVTVFETADDAEALVVHGLLESDGLQSILVSEYGQNDLLAGAGTFRVRVLPERAEEARKVIEEYRAAPCSDFEASGEPGAGS